MSFRGYVRERTIVIDTHNPRVNNVNKTLPASIAFKEDRSEGNRIDSQRNGSYTYTRFVYEESVETSASGAKSSSGALAGGTPRAPKRRRSKYETSGLNSSSGSTSSASKTTKETSSSLRDGRGDVYGVARVVLS